MTPVAKMMRAIYAIRPQLYRFCKDRRMLLCAALSMALAVLMSKPQGLSLEAARTMELSELLARFHLPEMTRQAFEDWYARAYLLPALLGSSATMAIPAAIVGSDLVGSCLTRPVASEIYAGRSRTYITLGLCGAAAILAAAFSLLLSGLILLFFGRDLLALTGAAALPVIGRAVLWRLFFDVAAFCPVMMLAFLTHEPYAALSVGSMLAAATTIMNLLRDALWWYPTYAVQSVLQTAPQGAALWRYVWPSLLLLALCPIAGVILTRRREYPGTISV